MRVMSSVLFAALCMFLSATPLAHAELRFSKETRLTEQQRAQLNNTLISLCNRYAWAIPLTVTEQAEDEIIDDSDSLVIDTHYTLTARYDYPYDGGFEQAVIRATSDSSKFGILQIRSIDVSGSRYLGCLAPSVTPR